MEQDMRIIGRLGKDPEMRYTPSGLAVTNFSVATDHQYTDNAGQRVKDTTWFRVQVWGKRGEVCNQYLRLGSVVQVKGRMVKDPTSGGPRIWTGKDGLPRAQFEINAQDVKFLPGGSKRDDAIAPDEPQFDDALPPDDDIPF